MFWIVVPSSNCYAQSTSRRPQKRVTRWKASGTEPCVQDPPKLDVARYATGVQKNTVWERRGIGPYMMMMMGNHYRHFEICVSVSSPQGSSRHCNRDTL